MPKSGQPVGQLLDPFLGVGGQRLQDGLKLCRISFYPPLIYHKAKESTGANPEGTFQGVQFHTVLSKEVECLLEMISVIRALLGFQ